MDKEIKTDEKDEVLETLVSKEILSPVSKDEVSGKEILSPGPKGLKDEVSGKEILSPGSKGCSISHSQFVFALIAIILAAVLINLWIRVINNFVYTFLKYSSDSFWVALIVALVATGILIIYIVVILDEDTSLQMKSKISGLSLGGAIANATNFDLGGDGGLDDSNNNDNNDIDLSS